MYKITKDDGTALGYSDSCRYIKIGKSGCFVPSEQNAAVGIVLNGTVYNLSGHSEIPDAETVKVTPVDGGLTVQALIEANSGLLETISTLSDDLTNTQLALCDVYEMMTLSLEGE